MSDLKLVYPTAPGYDWRKTLTKGLKSAFVTLGSIALYGAIDAIAQQLSNPAVVTGLLGPLVTQHPSLLMLVPAIVGVAGAFENWRKNR